MSPFQQAIVLTTSVFMLGMAMIVGAVALRPPTPLQLVIAPQPMSGDDMGVSGSGYETDGKTPVAPNS